MSKMETALKVGQQIAKDPKPAVMVCDILASASISLEDSSMSTAT